MGMCWQDPLGGKLRVMMPEQHLEEPGCLMKLGRGMEGPT